MFGPFGRHPELVKPLGYAWHFVIGAMLGLALLGIRIPPIHVNIILHRDPPGIGSMVATMIARESAKETLDERDPIP